MNPAYDIVCLLLETPFSRWKDEDKKDVLNCGRPTETLQICGTKEVKHSGKSYNLSFKRSWFVEFPWLCSSPALQKLFCWPCLLFSNKRNVWNTEGFAALLNITRSLHKHADSAEHLKCQVNLKTFERNRNTISDALKENARLYTLQFNENVRLNRLCLQLVIDAVLFLSKQELAFRGHDETADSINRGNFKELLTLLISRSPVEIQYQYSKIKSVFSGESKSIQNELLDCISEYINEYVKTELETAAFFSVQVDDTTDITQMSQCSVIVRYVNAKGSVVERFLGFHDVSFDRTSETLFALLDNVLGPFGYEHKLVGQCYDGASVMSGHLNGLQKKIKEKAPLAVFVHCFAHRLNLVLQQTCKKIRQCRIFFSSITGIPTFFHHSAKRTYAITSASGPRIPTVTSVRWSSNSKLLRVIVDDWEKLKEVFEAIASCEQSDNNSIQLARGFLNDINNFEFAFLAVVFHDIFCLTDILFDVLQKRSLDVTYCIKKIRNTCNMLRNKRNEQYFSTVFEKANKLADMHLLREHRSLSQDERVRMYRTLYYEILDHIMMEINERFCDCEKIQFVCLADTTKFEEYHACFPTSALENLQNFFGPVFPKTQRLRNELCILYADEKYRKISAERVLEMLHEDKHIFTDTYKLFSLILSISSTTASVERSFSCLKRIKTCLRNAMSEERLSSLANISIQKELLVQIIKTQPFYEDITDKFAALKDRRIDLDYQSLMDENRRLPVSGESRKMSGRRLQSIDMAILQTRVDTLQWQLKQAESSRQMYRAVMEQVVRFLDRVYKNLDIIKTKIDPGGIPKLSYSRVPRSRSVHTVDASLSRVSPVPESSASNFSRAKSIAQIEESQNYSTFRDFTWRRPRQESTDPDEIPIDKLSQEAFRLLRTAQSLLNTREPDLAQRLYSDNDSGGSSSHRSSVASHDEGLEQLSRKPDLLGSCSSLIQQSLDTTSLPSAAYSNNCLISGLESGFAGGCRASSLGHTRKCKAPAPPLPLPSCSNPSSSPSAPQHSSVSSTEDESGFSSMSSFQEVGLPLVSSSPTPKQGLSQRFQELTTKSYTFPDSSPIPKPQTTKPEHSHYRLHDLLESPSKDTKFESLPFKFSESAPSESQASKLGESSRRLQDNNKIEDLSYRFQELGLPVVDKPPATHRRWSSTPTETLQYSRHSASFCATSETLKVLWV